ncbi:MAG: hypothetical protein JNK78_09210 [Planctomycetes bacterium]|nr:hypothetical protein [Planctomycetota bacterium]
MRSLLCVLVAVAAVRGQSLPAETKLAVRMDPDAAGTYLRSEAAFVGDDTMRDMVVTVLTPAGAVDACYMPGPAECTMMFRVATGILDACVFPGAGPEGRDAILVLGPTGLHWFECAADHQKPRERFDLFDPSWAGFAHLWAGSDGVTPWLFAGGPSAGGIRRAVWTGAWTLVGTVPVPGDPTTVLTMDWGGGPEHELVLRYGSEVFVTTWGGTAIWYFQFPASPAGEDLLAVVPGNGVSKDLLVAFGWFPASPEWPVASHVLVAQYAGFSQVVDFGNVTAASLAGGDMDGDGRNDVLVGDATNSIVHFVRSGQAANGVTELVRAGQWDLVSGPDRPNGAVDALCAADFDGDQDCDLMALQQQERLHHFLAGDVVNVRPTWMQQHSSALTPNTLSWTVDVGLPMDVTQGPLPVELELRVWMQPSAAANLEPMARAVVRVPVPLGATTMSVPVEVSAAGLVPAGWIAFVYARAIRRGELGMEPLSSLVSCYSQDASFLDLRESRAYGDTTGAEIGFNGGDGDIVGGGVTRRPPTEPPDVPPTPKP